MWAQLIKVQLKPGKDTAELNKQLQAAEQPGTGHVRTLMMHDQKDPSQVYALVVFESEERAREREQAREHEQDPLRRERLQAVQATLADINAGSPEFVDLNVVEEWTS
jgi:hypothetical protein